jgi:hypothetical protein
MSPTAAAREPLSAAKVIEQARLLVAAGGFPLADRDCVHEGLSVRRAMTSPCLVEVGYHLPRGRWGDQESRDRARQRYRELQAILHWHGVVLRNGSIQCDEP